MKNRLKKKLKAKKILEQQKPKPILPYVPRVPKKEYEMPAKYQENLAALMEMIEDRDRYEKEIPNLPADVQKQAKPILDDLSKQIEIAEQSLADEYERYQAEKRRDDEVSNLIDQGFENMIELFIIMRRDVPHKFEEFKQAVTKDLPPELEQEFYDRVAIREAEIAAEKK